nr:unnamed protein product [Callosobruchus chinensis]
MLGYALYLKPRTIIVRSSVCSKRNIFLTLHFPCPLRETSTLLLEESPHPFLNKKSGRNLNRRATPLIISLASNVAVACLCLWR